MKKLCTEYFILKAKIVHGDKYIYDKSSYINNRVAVCITCKEHGDFFQRPDNHLSGRGCSKCGEDVRVKKRKTKNQDFINKAKSIHGDTYDYTESLYDGCFSPIKIKCKKHGYFYQSPSKHLLGQGCKDCGFEKVSISKLMTLDAFISKAREAHGDKYDYSHVKYKKSNDKVKIICNSHGSFMMTPNNHLNGQGCHVCAKTGFDKTKNGYIYFLIGEHGVKAGITNKINQRLKQLIRATPFDFHLIAKVKTTGAEAMRKEKYYHDKYESAGLTGFDGATEWLRYSPELMNEIMNERG